MASRLISFRLSDEAIEALSRFTLPNESINLAAQRLLLDALGLGTDNSVDKSVNTSVDNLVDRIMDSELFGDRLQEKLDFLVNGLNAKIQDYEQKLEKLEEQLSKSPTPTKTSRPKKPKGTQQEMNPASSLDQEPTA